MQTIFFTNISHLRFWLIQNQGKEQELWVGIYKKESGLQVMAWSEVVDEALCFGWSESRVKKIDAKSYAVRLGPRRPASKWGSKNIQKAEQFLEMGLMEASGKKAFQLRDKSQDNYDLRIEELAPEYKKLLQENADAWDYFSASTHAYQKTVRRWIMKAKREETRQKRIKILLECSEKGKKIPLFG